MKKLILDVICRREVYIEDDITDLDEITDAVEKTTGLPVCDDNAYKEGKMIVCYIADENNNAICEW